MIRSVIIRGGDIRTAQSDLSSLLTAGDSESDLGSRYGFRENRVPFQVTLISFDAADRIPYHLSFFSPGSYTGIDMDHGEYDALISRSELHSHNTYELTLVRKGTLYQRIEAERHVYPQGSCFLLNRNVRHNEEYDAPFSTVTLSLSEDFLKQTLEHEFSLFNPVHDAWDSSADLCRFLETELHSAEDGRKSYIDFIPLRDSILASSIFEDIALAVLDPVPGVTFLLRSLLCRLLYLLTDKELFTTVPVEIGTASEALVFNRITELLESGSGRIGRSELSHRLHYSGNYLNRITRKYTGMNLTDYSNAIAMRLAASMLLDTNISVSEIAERLSFSNRRQFYTVFERIYGTTPRQYRLEHSGRK